MSWEVEQKYRVADLAPVAQRLTELGGRWLAAVEQRDLYFGHPARDFASTDEALRLRRVGDANFITYKGPKVDATTKTRREIEQPLAPGDAAFQEFHALLLALGFHPVAEVAKQRRSAVVQEHGFEIEVALDAVPRAGQFVELETQAAGDQLDAARAALAAVAGKLQLHENERRSYLELLLAAEK